MTPEIIESISKMTAEGNRLLLPSEQINNYPQVKSTLQKAGGKYSKNGFTFEEPAQEIKDRLTGGEKINKKKDSQSFFTPPDLAEYAREQLNWHEDCEILEPSCGRLDLLGPEIINQVATLTLVEKDDLHVEYISKEGLDVMHADFLALDRSDFARVPFDRIIMNPPFTKNQDIDHILHAHQFLHPKTGRLVAFASTSWQHGSQKKQIAFRKWLEEVGAVVLNIAGGAFKSSGTNVSTVLIIIQK